VIIFLMLKFTETPSNIRVSPAQVSKEPDSGPSTTRQSHSSI
jgi:hypothetical protein